MHVINVDHVNQLMMECHVMGNASTEGNICGKVVTTSGGASGARGVNSGANSGDNS